MDRFNFSLFRLFFFFAVLVLIAVEVSAQVRFSGRVKDISETGLAGATVKSNGILASTDKLGHFVLDLPKGKHPISVSYTGYVTVREVLELSSDRVKEYVLLASQDTLAEVKISTGYYQVSPERSTGSFSVLRSSELQRNVSPNILQRLEGIVPGLTFDRRGNTSSDESGQIRLRGQSTLYASADPLIIVDNFPFTGDIGQLNPNDIENITFLRDAAAASIWGARAGNGVIVITTKKGKNGTAPKVDFNSNISVSTLPDLMKNRAYIGAADFIGVERQLFDAGYYLAKEQDLNKPALSPVIELLIARRDGKITSGQLEAELGRLGTLDVRPVIEDLFYRNSVRQQSSVAVSGGAKAIAYYFSGGYDYTAGSAKKDQNNRTTLAANITYNPFSRLELVFGLNYARSKTLTNGIEYSELGPTLSSSPFPYTEFVDIMGNPRSIVRDYRQSFVDGPGSAGLLDWRYVPLNELELNNSVKSANDLRLNLGARYKVLGPLSIELKYQFQESSIRNVNLNSEESYFTKNLINRYTQSDGSRPLPLGGILYNGLLVKSAQNIRAQLNYLVSKDSYDLNLLAGAEVNDSHSVGNGNQIFGYSDEILTQQVRPDLVTRFAVRPTGTAQLPLPTSDLTDLTDRFVSYYANLSYTYLSKYTVSASARKDASNLFGVDVNQKSVPLWSGGLSWLVSKEDFFKPGQVSSVRVRFTYGYNGNVDKSVTAFPTASYSNNSVNGLKSATIISPANPGLKWERVGIYNAGLDLVGKNNRWSISVDGYVKLGKDLIGETPLDPTIGFLSGSSSTYRINYASTRTKGIDVVFRLDPLRGKDFSYLINGLLSVAKDKVTKFDNKVNTAYLGYVSGLTGVPLENRPRYPLFSFPWVGLDGQGNPQVEINGVKSKNYTQYLQQLSTSQLIYNGSAVPTVYGSLLNSFSYKGISLSFNLSYKFGYYFRKKSIAYDGLFTANLGNVDFYDRWQKPGDESFTQVPSMPTASIANRDLIYLNSEINVERGDNIRLQDVNISYRFKPLKNGSRFMVYLNGNNLDILWRASNLGIDPDYNSALYPPVKSFTMGIRFNYN